MQASDAATDMATGPSKRARKARPVCVPCRTRQAKCPGPDPLDPRGNCSACVRGAIACDWPIRRRRRKRSDDEDEGEGRDKVGRLAEEAADEAVRDARLGHGELPPVLASRAPDLRPQRTAPSLPPPLNPAPASSTIHAQPDPAGLAPAHLTPDPAATSYTTAGEPYVKVYYHRLSGNTAIHPGLNRVSLKLRQGRAAAPTRHSHPVFDSAFDDVAFDQQTDLPPADIYLELVELFFVHLGQHFAAIDREQVLSRLANRNMSALVLNAMCACAARFSPRAGLMIANAGNVFAAKAQSMIIQLLHLPTLDGVLGLLLLGWAEFGQNSEAGLWQMSGMAIRMALDLGLHRYLPATYADESHFRRSRDLFWAVFMLDRLNCLCTGRACTIQPEAITMPLPGDTESIDRLPDDTANLDVLVVRLMELCGRIGDLLNGNRGVAGTFAVPVDTPDVLAQRLKQLQQALLDLYNNLGLETAWSAGHFKRENDRQRGGVYVFFHVWGGSRPGAKLTPVNAMLALTYHPAVLHKPRGSDTPLTAQLDHSLDLSLAASRNVCEMLAMTDLVGHGPLLSTPFITQALYFAGLTFAYQLRVTEHDAVLDPSSGSGAMLRQLARQNMQSIIETLQKMERYWAGIGYVTSILQQRARGLQHATIDYASSSDHIETTISLPTSALTDESAVLESSPAHAGGQVLESDSWLWQELLSSAPSSLDLFGGPVQSLPALSDDQAVPFWLR